MNKRFSTLLAGLALFGAVTANAQTPVTSLELGANEGLYQLKTGDVYLSMQEDGTLVTVDDVTSENLASTLWCVTVTAENAGKAPIFDFMNKATGVNLAIAYEGSELAGKKVADSMPAVVSEDGEVSGWAFYNTYATIKETTNGKQLYSHFTTDSVIGLVVEDGDVVVKKSIATSVSKYTKFVLVEAAPIVLAAEQINAMSEGSLIFDVNTDMTLELTNPFLAFKAKDVEDEDENPTGYVNLYNADKKVLSVDTEMTNVDGNKMYYKFAWNKKIDADLADTYNFQFVYYPSEDSVIIRVEGLPVNGEVVKTADPFATPVELADAEDEAAEAPAGIVTIAEFISTYIVTIDEKPVHISLGFTGCAEGSLVKPEEPLTIAEGLYVIKNAKGQVLASPIHNNGASYEWVTLDAQDPQHMPAYQWFVVNPAAVAKAAAEEAPAQAILNREYDNAKCKGTVSLSKDKDDNIITTIDGVALKGVTFEQITDSTILKDKNLGYKNFDEHEMMVAKYKFNYLHPYSDDMFVKVNAADKVLYANATDYSAFNVEAIEGKALSYGVAVPAGDAFKGIAALERMPYYIVLKGEYASPNAENKVVVAKKEDATYVVPMYLKENNCYNEKHYYAVVVATADGKDYVIANDAAHGWKVGVADDGKTANLKLQPVGETRTSAFAISIDDKPLYRRFNNAALNEDEDAAQIFRFYENVRGEYLMDESNPNLLSKVDYAGMWTADKANGKGLGFYVDMVDEGYGVKPQYLMHVGEEEYVGETTVKVIPCPEDITDPHKTHITADGELTDDPYKCVNAKNDTTVAASFVRGTYLVSFADSVKANGAKAPYADITKGYVRVGFVQAIRDTENNALYVLPMDMKAVESKDLDLAAIVKAVKPVSLKGEAHKNVTWSFRYVNPEVAATAVEEGAENAFLIESNCYDGVALAPDTAAWLKLQNGCLVLTNETSTFANTKTGGDGALVFNVEATTADDLATSNEAIAASEVTVVAGEGVVTIAGAAGKKVVITNILGQTVANTVITSDNATVAAPAGVVVVAVEGEAAVKAVVK